jgi:hypothetical protein
MREEVTIDGCRLHNDGLHDLYRPPRIVRAMISRMRREKKNVCRILMSKLKGRRPLGRPTRRLGYTIKTDIEETGFIWLFIRITLPDVVNSVMNLRVAGF